MAQLSIEIPEDLMQAIKLPVAEAPTRLRRELALRLYEKGLLSFGKARELAGMSRWAFHDLVGEEGIPRRYDVEELEEDLKTLEALG
jgi:predicted HTH domain antitoxin